jgi:hypothetical protein
MALWNYDISKLWLFEHLVCRTNDCLKIRPFELLKFRKLTVEIFAFCNLEFGKKCSTVVTHDRSNGSCDTIFSCSQLPTECVFKVVFKSPISASSTLKDCCRKLLSSSVFCPIRWGSRNDFSHGLLLSVLKLKRDFIKGHWQYLSNPLKSKVAYFAAVERTTTQLPGQ